MGIPRRATTRVKQRGRQDISSRAPVLRIERSLLVVPPFVIGHAGQRYVLAREIRIDLRRLEPDVYRVLAVQNFWVENCNPDLGECLAAVFLARRSADGRWEEPENWPIECRTLALLGHLDTHRIGGKGRRASARPLCGRKAVPVEPAVDSASITRPRKMRACHAGEY